MATAPNVQGNGLYVIGGYSKGTGELSSLWEFTCPTAGNIFWVKYNFTIFWPENNSTEKYTNKKFFQALNANGIF